MPTRPRPALPPRLPGDRRDHAGADRATHADGRRPAPRRRRARRSPTSSRQRQHVARHRALRRPLRDGRRGARARGAARGGAARRRRPAPLQRRPPRPDRGAASAGDGAGGDRGAPGRDARGSPASPTSCTTSSSSATARRRLDGLDELDGRLLVAAGERHRHGRVARDRVCVRARVRPALGQRDGRATRATSTRGPRTSERPSVRAWFCPEHGEALSHRVAKHDRQGAEPRPDRLAGAHVGPDPRDARRGREREPVRRRRRVDDTQVDQVFEPVAHERRQRVEDPAPPAQSSRARHSAGRRRFRGRRPRPTTSCTRRSSSPTTRSFVGSFNFSRSGERNAENVLEIRDAAIADRLAAFVDEIRARYPRATPPGA